MITIGACPNKLKNQVGDLFQTWSKNTKNPDQQYTKIKIIKEKKRVNVFIQESQTMTNMHSGIRKRQVEKR